MLTLAIDTSTNILSVALLQGEEVFASIDEPTKNNQSEILMSRIESMMNDCGKKPADLERIAVAVGPGSYTGIRVGVVAAKSLAYALNIPVVGISSLKVMAMMVVLNKGTVAPMIDARRSTVFASAFTHDGNTLIRQGHYEVKDFLSQLSDEQATFIGDGAVVNKEFLLAAVPDAVVISESEFTRSKACVLAELASKALTVENIHHLKPIYLRKTEAELNVGV